jgi:hypothetical protein
MRRKKQDQLELIDKQVAQLIKDYDAELRDICEKFAEAERTEDPGEKIRLLRDLPQPINSECRSAQRRLVGIVDLRFKAEKSLWRSFIDGDELDDKKKCDIEKRLLEEKPQLDFANRAGSLEKQVNNMLVATIKSASPAAVVNSPSYPRIKNHPLVEARLIEAFENAARDGTLESNPAVPPRPTTPFTHRLSL